MAALREAGEDDLHRMEAGYKDRLRKMDTRMREVRLKEKQYAHLEALSQRQQSACARLQGDIQSIKHQKARTLCSDTSCGNQI